MSDPNANPQARSLPPPSPATEKGSHQTTNNFAPCRVGDRSCEILRKSLDDRIALARPFSTDTVDRPADNLSNNTARWNWRGILLTRRVFGGGPQTLIGRFSINELLVEPGHD